MGLLQQGSDWLKTRFIVADCLEMPGACNWLLIFCKAFIRLWHAPKSKFTERMWTPGLDHTGPWIKSSDIQHVNRDHDAKHRKHQEDDSMRRSHGIIWVPTSMW